MFLLKILDRSPHVPQQLAACFPSIIPCHIMKFIHQFCRDAQRISFFFGSLFVRHLYTKCSSFFFILPKNLCTMLIVRTMFVQ